MPSKSSVIGIFLAVVAVFGLIAGSQMWEENDFGYMQVKQAFYTGNMSVISKPGFFCQCLGSLDQYKDAGTYIFSDNAETKATGGESLFGSDIPVRFSDGGTADISGSARFDLPVDEPGLLRVHKKFRSYQAVAAGLLKPAIREAVVLSAALMTSEESYSGGKAQLSQLALDQLQNGIYLTDSSEVETINPVTKQLSVERVVSIRRNDDGEPLRKANTLASYGIVVTQLFFPDDFAYEKKILEQIGNVRDTQMAQATAFALAETAVQNEKTALAEGRASVALAKAEADVIKQKAVTAAEQARDVVILAAQSRRAVAKEDQEAAGFEKAANILRGEGEAARNKLVFESDGALKQKLAAYVQANEFWAAAHAVRPVPTTVFGGGTGAATGTDTLDFMDLMSMKAAKDLALDISTK